MRFYPITDKAFSEIESRRDVYKNVMQFGVDFLDDSLKGILRDDLVLIGAPSGVGKTALCCNIALANVRLGHRVHYIALEAAKDEIARRIKFPILMNSFYSDPNRPQLGKIDFDDWAIGKFLDYMTEYESRAAELFQQCFQNLHMLYQSGSFSVNELIESVLLCSKQTDLIIIDHVHYFDFDPNENENAAMKQIAKTCRTLVLDIQKPIVLVAHLRKRDRNSQELVAGLDEFHGSSDLTKIATKVVTIASGGVVQNKAGEVCYETFFRTPKNRNNGGSTRFIGRELFSPRCGGYLDGKYKLGWSSQRAGEDFSEVPAESYPHWAQRSGRSSRNLDNVPERKYQPFADT